LTDREGRHLIMWPMKMMTIVAEATFDACYSSKLIIFSALDGFLANVFQTAPQDMQEMFVVAILSRRPLGIDQKKRPDRHWKSSGLFPS
jgi:hypothetical protein